MKNVTLGSYAEVCEGEHRWQSGAFRGRRGVFLPLFLREGRKRVLLGGVGGLSVQTQCMSGDVSVEKQTYQNVPVFAWIGSSARFKND